VIGVLLVAAAVCPHPPMIVPEIAGAAAPELDDLRAACDAAIGRLVTARPDAILVLGSGPETTDFGPSDYGTFAPYGLDLRVYLQQVTCASRPVLPLSLTVGAWLLNRCDTAAPRRGQAVGPDAPAACLLLGRDLIRRHGQAPESRVALLVMGDGSACREGKAPGYDDPRAQPYDDAVAVALAGADAGALRDLDPGLSAQLKVAGRAPWQVLAGAAQAAGGKWRGDLSYYAAPYGVAYFVATWEPAR
jgi:hypothetical protein